MLHFISQRISDWIPSESKMVNNLYDQATTQKDIIHQARYLYASCAITCSSVNVLGYGILLISRVITSVIHREMTPQKIQKDCYYDARRSINSLYFAAGLATLIFASIFKPDVYSLKLKQMSSPTSPDRSTHPSAPPTGDGVPPLTAMESSNIG